MSARRNVHLTLAINDYDHVPWGPANAQRAREIFCPDFWPYGIEPNRITLDAFLELAHEQGVCARRLQPEDLFPAQVATAFLI